MQTQYVQIVRCPTLSRNSVRQKVRLKPPTEHPSSFVASRATEVRLKFRRIRRIYLSVYGDTTPLSRLSRLSRTPTSPRTQVRSLGGAKKAAPRKTFGEGPKGGPHGTSE